MASKKTEERFDNLDKKVHKKTEVDKTEFAQSIATRAKLERDYKEDLIYVSFNTSPETKRTVIARRPTKKEFIDILSLSIKASKFEGLGDSKSLEELGNVYSGLNSIAAKVTIDKTLDEEFWESCVSFVTLQNFIGELVNASQQLGVGGISEEEMKKFR